MAKIVGIDRKLFMRRFFGSKFNSHNIGNNSQSNSNDKQSITNLSTIDNRVKLFSSHCENRSNIIAMIMLTIPRVRDFVNVAGSKLTNPGPINTKANQPADKFPLIPERTRKNDFLIAVTLAKIGIDYKFGMTENI